MGERLEVRMRAELDLNQAHQVVKLWPPTWKVIWKYEVSIRVKSILNFKF